MNKKIEHVNSELLRYRLDKPVGGSGVASVDVIVVDIELSAGSKGMGFSYVLGDSGEVTLAATRDLIERFVKDQPLEHPEKMVSRIRESFNRLGRGPLYIAMAAIDVAIWDVYAKDLGVSVGSAMGGQARTIPVYGSGGFNAKQSMDEVVSVTSDYLERGVTAIKPRVSGRPEDEKIILAVSDLVDEKAFVMVDANEKCTIEQAKWLCGIAQDAGVLFVEEPLGAYDLNGYRLLKENYSNLVATGEHLQGIFEAQLFIEDDNCAVFQPDLAMMGGLTECLRVAKLAEAMGVNIAPHFLPSIFIHLAAAAPNVTWLEDFPLLEPLFGNPQCFQSNGMLTLPETAGLGFNLDEAARSEFLIKI